MDPMKHMDPAEKGSHDILVAIQQALFSNTGLLVGRFGTIEFDVCWESENGYITKDTAAV